MNKELCNEIINCLTNWKDAFLKGSDWSFEKSLGVECITDYLENINQNEHDCYASYLFNQLNDDDKKYILNNLDDDFLEVNFDRLEVIYYL